MKTSLFTAGLLFGLIGATGGMTPAAAQSDYPSKPITLIVPFAAGSGTDADAGEYLND